MADVIDRANVARVFKDGDRWLALIGPDAQRGVIGSGINPVSALLALAARCALLGWTFDESWEPNPGPTSLLICYEDDCYVFVTGDSVHRCSGCGWPFCPTHLENFRCMDCALGALDWSEGS
jgi:hypothetical protein